MVVLLKIPKSRKENIKITRPKNNSDEIEIINSTEFNRANIRFLKDPPNEVIQLLLASGWCYSTRKKIWYPKGQEAAIASYGFAKLIKHEFFEK